MSGCFIFLFDFRKKWTRQKVFPFCFKFAGSVEKKGVHPFQFMLLHVHGQAFPMGQIVGDVTLKSNRSHLMMPGLRQLMVTVLDLVGKCQLVLWDALVENLANGFIDFVVHFEDIRFADIAYFTGLHHVQHALQLCLVRQILLRIWLGWQACLPFAYLLTLFLLVVFED